MKFTVNLEATDDELKKFVADTLVNAVMGGLSEVFQDPTFAPALQTALGGIAQTIQQSLGQGAVRVRRGPPPMTYGPQPYPPPPAAYPPGYQPGYGPVGPFAASQQNNVHPMRGSAGVVEKCFPIEATRNSEAGIGCCRCATFNGLNRASCRHCGHPFCHVIAPPPPAPAPVPEPLAGP